MKKVSLLLLILPLSLIHLSGQSIYLEFSNETAIGPKNVNWYFGGQINYYVGKYEELIETLVEYENEYHEEIKGIKNKKIIRKKDRTRVSELQEYLTDLKNEQEILLEYISLWEALEINDYSNQLSQLDFESKCYDIASPNGFYSPNEYDIIELNLPNKLHWTEKINYAVEERKTEKVLVERAKEEWVKKKADRNCLSANPDDCMVWCLVKIPAKYKTELISKGGKVCDESFYLNEDQSECLRVIEIAKNTNEPTKIYKIVETNTDQEIVLVNTREVKCN